MAPGLLSRLLVNDDARELESPADAGEGDPHLPPPADPVADYCAACGVRAPELPPEVEPRGLRALGWLVLPPTALHDEVWPRIVRNTLCAACLSRPSPFVAALLQAWGVVRAAGFPS